jgi:hypothetical protein
MRSVPGDTSAQSLSCMHEHSREALHEEQTCQISGLSYDKVYSITIASTLNGFVEPEGVFLQALSPMEGPVNAGVCYANYAEIAIEWQPPPSGILPDKYRISYSVLKESSEEVLAGGANTSHLVSWTADIPQSGWSRASWQRETVAGLLPQTTYQFRVHTVNRNTGLVDPVGTGPVIVATRADRGGFVLALNALLSLDDGFAACQDQGSCSYVMIAPYIRASDRNTFQPRSLSLETWVKIAPHSSVDFVGERRIAILGNLYSVQRGLASFLDTTGENSGAKGHFGYGLFCDLDSQSVGVGGTWTCTMAVAVAGSDRGTRCDASATNVQGGVWAHMAGTYDEPTATVTVIVNGNIAATTNCEDDVGGQAGLGPRRILYEAPDRSIYLTPQMTGEGLVTPGLPMLGMGFALGRLLLANFARTAAECPPAFFLGYMDQVRLWSYARPAAAVFSQAMMDTVPVAPPPPTLLGYWPMDDPIDLGLCAQSLPGLNDAISSSMAPLLHGAKVLQVSEEEMLPIDKEPVLALRLVHDSVPLTVQLPSHASSNASNTSTTSHNASTRPSELELRGDETITAFVGDTLRLQAEVSDANPSDTVQLFLHLQGEVQTHPSGLIVESSKSGGGGAGEGDSESSRSTAAYMLNVSWAPLVRDSGKVTNMCFVTEGQRFNPSRPSAVYASASITRCITVIVPSCQVRVKRGDTLRSIAEQHHIPWRSLFLINPHLTQAGDGLMFEGQVLSIGRTFKLNSPNARYRYSIENASSTFSVPFTNIYNHNAASVFRLLAPGI